MNIPNSEEKIKEELSQTEAFYSILDKFSRDSDEDLVEAAYFGFIAGVEASKKMLQVFIQTMKEGRSPSNWKGEIREDISALESALDLMDSLLDRKE